MGDQAPSRQQGAVDDDDEDSSPPLTTVWCAQENILMLAEGAIYTDQNYHLRKDKEYGLGFFFL